MLLRFVVKNLYSFKEETEFNLFPSSRAAHHLHHKIKCGDVEALRLTALYGANGAGKSNLVKALQDFKNIVSAGNIGKQVFQSYKFQFSKVSLEEPVSMAIEFCIDDVVYYYSLEMDTGLVSYESLSISTSKKDVPIFERKSNGAQVIKFGEGYLADKVSRVFSDALQQKLVGRETLLLSFMATNYPEEISDITKAYTWIKGKMHVLNSGFLKNMALAEFFDRNPVLKGLLENILTGTNTGISSVSIDSHEIKEDQLSPELVKQLKDYPGIAITIPNMVDSRISNSVI